MFAYQLDECPAMFTADARRGGDIAVRDFQRALNILLLEGIDEPLLDVLKNVAVIGDQGQVVADQIVQIRRFVLTACYFFFKRGRSWGSTGRCNCKQVTKSTQFSSSRIFPGQS